MKIVRIHFSPGKGGNNGNIQIVMKGKRVGIDKIDENIHNDESGFIQLVEKYCNENGYKLLQMSDFVHYKRLYSVATLIK